MKQFTALLWLLLISFAESHEVKSPAPTQAVLSVADFLPQNHVKNGSVRYQEQIQKAIDEAASKGHTLVFPPMTYALDENGLRLRSRSRLSMHGAIFRLDADCKKDGQAFHGHDVKEVSLEGGEIVGRNDVWPDGLNIRGIYITGKSGNLRFRDLHLRDLSSNGLGVFGDAKEYTRDVWVSDMVIENSCNRYGDYLSERVGPEKGSVREDQGLIAFYHIQDFVVRGCRFE